MSRDECRIYVGNLPGDVRNAELEDLFRKYGKILDVAVKGGSSTSAGTFAFITFEDRRDAADAVRGRSGIEFAGARLRVEFSKSGARERSRQFGGEHSKYRIVVTNLPRSASWQDLKDFAREAGDVVFTDVRRDGTGVVEFLRESEMEHALRHLHGRKMRSHLNESAVVSVEEDGGHAPSRRSRSRSPRPRSRSRSPRPRSRSPRRRSRSRSRSPR